MGYGLNSQYQAQIAQNFAATADTGHLNAEDFELIQLVLSLPTDVIEGMFNLNYYQQ